jgi:hypothetical protein
MGILDTVGGALFGDLDSTNNRWASQDRNNYNLAGQEQRGQAAMGAFNQAGQRQAPVFAAQDSAARAQQMQAADYLNQQMQGRNLLSAEQLRQGQMQNVAQQQAMAASAAPGNQAMAQRQAMMNAGRQGYGMSGQAAMAGIAERNAAANAYGGMLGQIRGQDLGLSQFNAGQAQQGYYQNQGQNDARQQGMLGLDLANAQAGQQGGIAYEQDRTNRFNAAAGQPTAGGRLLGGALGLMEANMKAGSAAAASDIRAKENIAPGGKEADAFMSSVSPSSWEYKAEHKGRPEAGAGRYLGVMAQDLERTPAGKAAVTDTANGKVVDFGKLGGIMTAALARLHERLGKVEGK